MTQDDIGAAAGVTTRWYGSLERGEIAAPELPRLDAVAEALQLSEDRRYDLVIAATGAPPSRPRRPAETPSEAALGILRDADPMPAFVLDHAFNLLAANKAFDTLFVPAGLVADERSNFVEWLFAPGAQAMVVEVASVRIRAVDAVKRACCRYSDSGQLEKLVDTLKQIPDAADLWMAPMREHAHGSFVTVLRHGSNTVSIRTIRTEFADGTAACVMLCNTAMQARDDD